MTLEEPLYLNFSGDELRCGALWEPLDIAQGGVYACFWCGVVVITPGFWEMVKEVKEVVGSGVAAVDRTSLYTHACETRRTGAMQTWVR
jgi:hypothetical protein